MSRSFLKICSDIISSFNIWPNTNYQEKLYKYGKSKHEPYGFMYGDSVLLERLEKARQQFLHDMNENHNRMNAIKFIKQCNECCMDVQSPHTSMFIVLSIQDVDTINYIKTCNLKRFAGEDVFKISTDLSNYINKLQSEN